jgi:hypothetical protein
MSFDGIDCESWIGGTLIDREDRKVGRIEAIYFDEQTGRPQWMVVKAGLLGNRHDFVPLDGAAIDGDAVRTPFDKSQIDDAPKIDPDEDLREDQVIELYGYYGLAYDAPVAGRDVIVEREIVLPPTDRDTQAQDDMLVATGSEPVLDPVVARPMTQAEEDMLVATGRTAPRQDIRTA